VYLSAGVYVTPPGSNCLVLSSVCSGSSMHEQVETALWFSGCAQLKKGMILPMEIH